MAGYGPLKSLAQSSIGVNDPLRFDNKYYQGDWLNDYTKQVSDPNYSVSMGMENTIRDAAAKEVFNPDTPETFSLGGLMKDLGLTNDKGELFGVSDGTWGNLSTLGGLASGIFGIMNSRDNMKMMEDYYDTQMGIMKENQQYKRDEIDRIKKQRADATQAYFGNSGSGNQSLAATKTS